MRKFLTGMLFMALAGTLALAAPPQDRDDRRDRDERHDNGKHKGDKHGDRDDDDRRDNGKHKGWDKHDRDDYRNWMPIMIASAPAVPILAAVTNT